MEKPTATRSDPEARRAYGRWHYQQNKEAYKKRAKLKTDETRKSIRYYLLQYLLCHPCVDCGEKDPIVLEFDHKDGVKKKFNIGDSVSAGYSVKTVQTEVKKCDVRCANCHRRKTYLKSGYKHRG